MRVDAIEAKIYVEGVLLPGRAWGTFECTSRKRGNTTGSLVIPALPGIRQEEWARARVHVFWSDIDIRNQTTDWPILFEGEIIGSGFSKSPGSRNISFQLMGPEIYWDQCKLYFYSFDKSASEHGGSNLDVVNVNKKSFFFGAKSLTIEGGAPGLNLENMFMSKITEGDPSEPLTSKVRRAIKDVVGGTNYFFARANDQLQLDRRFALPRDDNVTLLYSNQQLMFAQIEGNVAAREADVPISQVIKETLALLRYGWTCNPQPRITSGGQQYRLRVEQERTRLRAEVERIVVERLSESLDDIGVTGASTDEDLRAVARQKTQSLELVGNDLQRAHTLQPEDFELLEDPATTAADMAERNRQRIGETFAFLVTVRDELRRIDQPATEVDSNPLFPSSEELPQDALAQFLLLPETDFSLPPVCNVIFPSESASYGLARDYLSEITRYALSAPIVSDAIRKVYYAPDSLSEAKIPSEVITHSSSTGTYPPVLVGLKLPRISSGFGLRSVPVARSDGKTREPHGGLDFAVPIGTLVYAFDDGVVVWAGPQDKRNLGIGGGIYVSIKHANGVKTQYLHLSAVDVGVGDKVKAGQVVGRSGNTGRSSGPHLHFNYIVNNIKRDPLPMVMQAYQGFINGQSEGQSIELPEVTIVDGIENESERFDDFKYLTPEEEILGIVPMYDTSMDKVSAAFARENPDELDTYLSQYALANFQRNKYGARAANTVPMPWSPRVVAGFPALIVDPVRSYIAQVESVTHRLSVQGGADASTMVSVSQPRFWDEGDPYFWRGGEERFRTGEQVPNVPDVDYANFPSFHLASLIGTNSYQSDPSQPSDSEPFGGKNSNRPIDELYKSILGVGAIPYYYAERENQATGATVSFNQAIDGLQGDGTRGARTIVGYYESLLTQGHELAQRFAREYTQRLGATESEIMVNFLGATPGKGGYTGGPFRDRVRGVVEAYVQQLQGARSFRG